MNTKDLLRKEIDSVLEQMGGMAVGSDEHKVAAETVAKLIDRLDEMEQTELKYAELAEETEHREKQLEIEKRAHEDEQAYRAQQAVEERHKMIINIVLTGIGIVVPAGLTVWGTYKTFKFEETGTITTTLGRGFINKLLFKK